MLRLQKDKIEKITIQENTGAEKSKLFPTDLGLVVTDFLNLAFYYSDGLFLYRKY